MFSAPSFFPTELSFSLSPSLCSCKYAKATLTLRSLQTRPIPPSLSIILALFLCAPFLFCQRGKASFYMLKDPCILLYTAAFKVSLSLSLSVSLTMSLLKRERVRKGKKRPWSSLLPTFGARVRLSSIRKPKESIVNFEQHLRNGGTLSVSKSSEGETKPSNDGISNMQLLCYAANSPVSMTKILFSLCSCITIHRQFITE